MARILLGVTGGIAAYKALELARLATKSGHSVRVLQTPTSERFVGRSSFEALTGAPVLVDEFERDCARGAYPGDQLPEHEPISHLELVQRADIYAIAPATANTLAKLAAGIADNIVCTAHLACTAPVLVAPAMNDRMWAHPSTQANIETLRSRGVSVVEPTTGSLASRGEWGAGRLAEPADLLAAIEQLTPQRGVPRSLDGLRVLITAGGTREPIDSVRFVGNRSSGRMGFALAEEAAQRGASVTVLAANVELPRSPAITYIDTPTTDDLQRVARECFADCDVLLMAAAVADFRVRIAGEEGEVTAAGKLERSRAGSTEIKLEATPDILCDLVASRGKQLIVGFAAEHGDSGLERARHKLAAKGADAIVFNDISRSDIGFEAGENEVVIVSSDEERHVPRASKRDVGAAILDWVEQRRVSERDTAIDERQG